MSMIDPSGRDYVPPMWPPEDDGFDDNWDPRSDPQSFHGGWQQRPPSGQCPPGGWFPERWGKYQWPFWGHWGYRLRNAWKDIKFLTDLIHDIIGSMIDSGIVAPGPNAPTTGPGSGTGTTAGIKGVTDGSDAGPGQVGEYIQLSQTFPFTGDEQTVPIILGPVGPGDWDVQIWFFQTGAPGLTKWIGGGHFTVEPYPTGVSDGLNSSFWTSAGAQDMTMASPRVRANLSVPTLFPCLVNINAASAAVGGPQPGTMQGTIAARRMR